MGARTVELDEEAYEILSRKRQGQQSLSAVIKEQLGEPGQGTGVDLLRMADKCLLSEETLDAIEEQGKISTARDLLEYVKNMKISEEALDRMEEVVQSRRRSPARIIDL
jgi:predicted CopG family antitoxin